MRNAASLKRQYTSVVGPRRQAVLKMHGLDQPGLVAKITQLMGARGLNIDRLETKVRPQRNHDIFEVSGVVELGPNVDHDELQKAARDLAKELGVTMTFEVPPGNN